MGKNEPANSREGIVDVEMLRPRRISPPQEAVVVLEQVKLGVRITIAES